VVPLRIRWDILILKIFGRGSHHNNPRNLEALSWLSLMGGDWRGLRKALLGGKGRLGTRLNLTGVS